ncbi:MAG: ferritin-like domain-containing protein [Myxococcota bacterium]
MKTAPQDIVSALNRAVAIERAAALQYKHNAATVRGLLRPVYRPFFAAQGDEAMSHADRFGLKIVAMGGELKTDVAEWRAEPGLQAMLRSALALEKRALATYQAALELAGDTALRNMLEDQIDAEQSDVEELTIMLEDYAHYAAAEAAE